LGDPTPEKKKKIPKLSARKGVWESPPGQTKKGKTSVSALTKRTPDNQLCEEGKVFVTTLQFASETGMGRWKRKKKMQTGKHPSRPFVRRTWKKL